MNVIRLLNGTLCVYLLTLNSYAAEFQHHESIYAAAKNFVQTNFAPQTEYELTLSSLDPRLQLNQCEQPPEAFSTNTALKPGRNAIGVRCSSKQSWSLYLNAYIKVYENIVIVTQPIKRGDILSEMQLSLTRQEVSQLRSGYITDINSVINQQATHNLGPGTPINNKDFSKAIIIKRGESVVITSNKAYMNIQMQGVAMSDGAQGQSIRIKNTSSGRIITAIVVQQGMVSVNF